MATNNVENRMDYGRLLKLIFNSQSQSGNTDHNGVLTCVEKHGGMKGILSLLLQDLGTSDFSNMLYVLRLIPLVVQGEMPFEISLRSDSCHNNRNKQDNNNNNNDIEDIRKYYTQIFDIIISKLDDKPLINDLKACGCLQGLLLNSINSFNENLLAKWFKKEQLLNAFNVLCKNAMNTPKQNWEYYSQNSNEFKCKNCCIDSIAAAEQSNVSVSSNESPTGATQMQMLMTKLPFSTLDRITVALGNCQTRINRTSSNSNPNEFRDEVLQIISNNNKCIEYLLECYMNANEWTDWEIPLHQTVASIIHNVSLLIPITKIEKQSKIKNNHMVISDKIFSTMMRYLLDKEMKNHDAALQAKCSDLWQSLLRIRLRLTHPYDWHSMIIVQKKPEMQNLFALSYISAGIMSVDTPDEHYDRGWACLAILLEEISHCFKAYSASDLKYKKVFDVVKLIRDQLICLTVESPLKDVEGKTCYNPKKTASFIAQQHVTAAAYALSCCSRVCFPRIGPCFKYVYKQMCDFSVKKSDKVPCTQFCVMLVDIVLGWPDRKEVICQGPPPLIPIHRYSLSNNQRNNVDDPTEDEEIRRWEEKGIFSWVNYNDLDMNDAIKILNMLSCSVGVLSHHDGSSECQTYVEACIWTWQRVIRALAEYIMNKCKNDMPSSNETAFELTLNIDGEPIEVLKEIDDKVWIFEAFEEIMGIVARDFAYDGSSTYKWRGFQLDSIWWLMHRLSTFGIILNKGKLRELPTVYRSGLSLVGDIQHLEALRTGHENHASRTALAMTVLFLLQLEQTSNDNNIDCEELAQLCIKAVEAVVHAMLMTHQFSILQWLRTELLYNYYSNYNTNVNTNDDNSNLPPITIAIFTGGPALTSPLVLPSTSTSSSTVPSTAASSSSKLGLAGRLVTKLLLRISARMLEQLYGVIDPSAPNSTAPSQLELHMQKASQMLFSGEESDEMKMESQFFQFVALPLHAMARALPSSEAFVLSQLTPTLTSESSTTTQQETDYCDWWCSVLKRWVDFVTHPSMSLPSSLTERRSTLQGWIALPYALPIKEAASAVHVYVPLLGYGLDILNKKIDNMNFCEGKIVIKSMAREIRVLLAVTTQILAKSVEASLLSEDVDSDINLKYRKMNKNNCEEKEGEGREDTYATSVRKYIGEMCLVQEWKDGDILNRPLLHLVVGVLRLYVKGLLEDQVRLQRMEFSTSSSTTKLYQSSSSSSSSTTGEFTSGFHFMLTGLFELELHLLETFPTLITVIKTLPEEYIEDGIYVENKSRTIQCLKDILNVNGTIQTELGDKRWQQMIGEIHSAVSEHLRGLGKRSRSSTTDLWRDRQKKECQQFLQLELFRIFNNNTSSDEGDSDKMVYSGDDATNLSQIQTDVYTIGNQARALMEQLLNITDQLNRCPPSDEKSDLEGDMLNFVDDFTNKVDPSQRESQHRSANTQDMDI